MSSTIRYPIQNSVFRDILIVTILYTFMFLTTEGVLNDVFRDAVIGMILYIFIHVTT